MILAAAAAACSRSDVQLHADDAAPPHGDRRAPLDAGALPARSDGGRAAAGAGGSAAIPDPRGSGGRADGDSGDGVEAGDGITTEPDAAAPDGGLVDPPCVHGECSPERVCNTATQRCEPACDLLGTVDALSPWPMFSGCPTNRGLSRYTGASDGNVKWSAELGHTGTRDGRVAPTIGRDGTVYVSGESDTDQLPWRIHAFAADGTPRFLGLASILPPSIASDGTLWLTTIYPSAALHHVAADGTPLGTRDTRDISSRMSPHFLPGGDLVIGDSSIDRYAPDLSPVWTRRPEGGSAPREADFAVAPDGTVYADAAEGGFVAVAPDGSERWTHPTPDGSCWALTVGHDGTIYAGSTEALQAVTPLGEERWSYRASESTAEVRWISVAPDGTVVVRTAGVAYAIYATSPAGNELWHLAEPTGHDLGRPVIDRRGTVYVGHGSALVALDASTGDARWSYESAAGPCGSPAIGADGTIYVVCGTRLFALGD